MTDGIINVYKEKGYTSHDVVAKMRGILKMKKIGHTGTLDPDAEGVLPICIGKGTRLVDLITDKDKTYAASCKLGITTDTQDISGKILSRTNATVTLSQLQEAIKAYIGEYMQLPPMYSAIRVDGKKLYELARQGLEVERERRRVVIHDIRLEDFDEEKQEFKVTVHCGKGTYIRTLLHDIGERLGCGACMVELTRTAVGSFSIHEALRLSVVEALVREDKLSDHIVKIEEIFCGYSKITLKQEYDKLVHNGNLFLPDQSQEGQPALPGKQVRVYDSEDRFIGIYEFSSEKGAYTPVKMFL